MGMYDAEEYMSYEYEDAHADGEGGCYTECTCHIEKETPKAYMFYIKEADKVGWFPKSQIKHLADDTYIIPNWLIVKLLEDGVSL